MSRPDLTKLLRLLSDFDSGLIGCVNLNPVGEYGPGELLCVGPRDLRARTPGWNHFQHGDGRWYHTAAADGTLPYPPVFFNPELVTVATVTRHGIPAGALAGTAVVDVLPAVPPPGSPAQTG